MSKTIAFIGTGNMSYAIIGGMINQGFNPEQIIATNRNQDKLAKVAEDFKVQTESDNIKAIEGADVVVLSVKPQMMEALCQSFAASDINLTEKLFISVAAGITVQRLREMLGFEAKLVRCMPNTPCLVGLGVSGLYTDNANDEEKQLTNTIFQATGETLWLESEQQINDIIAVTGSSPAYFFLFMEAIQDKAKQLGFNEQQARLLVKQTALGAATMVEKQSLPISQLRNNVTSKGGTTAAAIAHFQQNQLDSIVSGAMDACIARAKQMEKEI